MNEVELTFHLRAFVKELCYSVYSMCSCSKVSQKSNTATVGGGVGWGGMLDSDGCHCFGIIFKDIEGILIFGDLPVSLLYIHAN